MNNIILILVSRKVITRFKGEQSLALSAIIYTTKHTSFTRNNDNKTITRSMLHHLHLKANQAKIEEGVDMVVVESNWSTTKRTGF